MSHSFTPSSDEDQFAIGTFRGFDMRGGLIDSREGPVTCRDAGYASKPRFIVLPSLGSLSVVYDTVGKRSVEQGRRFQPEAARREADRLNASVIPA